MLPLTRLDVLQTVSVPFQPHAGPTRAIQIPIAPSDCRPCRAPPAVSSLEAYQTPTADRCNRQAQLQYPVRRLRRSPRIGGRHLITLNSCGPSPRSQARCQKTLHQPDGHRTRYVYLWPNPAVRPLPSRRRRKISDPRTVWDISESRNRPEAVFIDYFGVEENGAMARPNFSVNDRGHLFAMFVEREVAPYTYV